MAGTKTGYLTIQNFRFGLDARRSELTSQPGTLLRAVDCHINQGAEIEKRKALVKTAMPANVFLGLAGLSTQYAFGSIAAPVMPAGFTYQQLLSPYGMATAMTKLVGATLFNNLPFAVATFGVNGTFCFYNGTLVADFYGGEVLSGLTLSSDQAAALVALINSTSNYSASAVGSTVTIVGTNGNNYTGTTIATSAGGVITGAQENIGVSATNAGSAIGSINILACAPGTGTSAQVSIVGYFGPGGLNNLLSAAVNATSDPSSLAINLASNINANIGSNGGYSALANGGMLTLYSPAGITSNTYPVAIETTNSSNNDGGVCVENCSFTFTAPVGGAISITNIASAVNGNIDTTARALSSFASLNAFLTQVATDIMVKTAGAGTVYAAVAVGGILYISPTTDSSTSVVDTITITLTISGGATVTGITSLSATSNLTSVSGGVSVTITPKGGVSPYTYAWTIDNPAIQMSSQAGNIITFSTNTTPNTAGNKTGVAYTSGTATCVISDSAGSKARVLVAVIIPYFF